MGYWGGKQIFKRARNGEWRRSTIVKEGEQRGKNERQYGHRTIVNNAKNVTDEGRWREKN